MRWTFKKGEFDWSRGTVGVLLGSFFYGYVAFLIPGGLVTNRFGAKSLLVVVLMFFGLISLIIPSLTRYSSTFITSHLYVVFTSTGFIMVS